MLLVLSATSRRELFPKSVQHGTSCSRISFSRPEKKSVKGKHLSHLSVTVSQQFVKNVTEFPADNRTLLNGSSSNDAPEEGGTLFLVSPDQYHWGTGVK
jgi:hypothetical protein